MIIKMIGAVLILLATGGYGFSLAAAHRREEQQLQALSTALSYMCCELEFRLESVSNLCRVAGQEARGTVGSVFLRLSQQLDQNETGNAAACMEQILTEFPKLPDRVVRHFRQLGNALGRYSLSGQLTLLQASDALCRRDIQSLSQDRDARLRSYRTLGLCAGGALIILFL